MRFLLYNIRYGAGTGPRFHLPLPYAGYLKRSATNLQGIISFLRQSRADLLGLVEVDGGSFRTQCQCQARQIAEALDLSYVVSEGKYGDDSVAGRVPLLRRQGNAILSRMPILRHRFHYFDQGVKRLVIEVELPLVTVFLVHLSLTYRNRQYQLERLYRLIAQCRQPVILAGDFNVLWGARELDLFLAATGLRNANHNQLPSHPSRSPRRQLDFILHSPELEVADFRIPRVLYSDHAPLICDFRIPTPGHSAGAAGEG